jgi:hypothetical protein
MGFLDRLFGGGDDRRPAPQVPQAPYGQAPRASQRPPMSDDELAIERYRYLLRTAPPESIEAVHAEAFAKLTPEQRQQVYRSLAEQAPAGERVASDDPQTLARAATRQELRQPGSMERAFAGGPAGRPGGPSFGSMVGGSLLGTVAGVVIGSAIAQAFLPGPDAFDSAGAEGAGDPGAGEGADAGDAGAAEAGGDWGGSGGDWGGGDFGGGDFGGDFGF